MIDLPGITQAIELPAPYMTQERVSSEVTLSLSNKLKEVSFARGNGPRKRLI